MYKPSMKHGFLLLAAWEQFHEMQGIIVVCVVPPMYSYSQ